jgi:hypothetical protein
MLERMCGAGCWGGGSGEVYAGDVIAYLRARLTCPRRVAIDGLRKKIEDVAY